MLLYLTLGFFFILLLKAGEASLESLGLPENEIEHLRFNNFQIIVVLITWPLWLMAWLSAFLIGFIFPGEDGEN